MGCALDGLQQGLASHDQRRLLCSSCLELCRVVVCCIADIDAVAGMKMTTRKAMRSTTRRTEKSTTKKRRKRRKPRTA